MKLLVCRDDDYRPALFRNEERIVIGDEEVMAIRCPNYKGFEGTSVTGFANGVERHKKKLL